MTHILRYSLAAIIISALFLSSCQGDRALGDWDPMELSDDQLIFDERGGSATVYCFNLLPMIHGIRDKKSGKYYYADIGVRYQVSAPGISVSIDKDKISVSVEPSEAENKWGVQLWSGNTFSAIAVYQNCKPDK